MLFGHLIEGLPKEQRCCMLEVLLLFHKGFCILVQELSGTVPSFLGNVCRGIPNESEGCVCSIGCCLGGEGPLGSFFYQRGKWPYNVQSEGLDAGQQTVAVLAVLGQLRLDRRVQFRASGRLTLWHAERLPQLPTRAVWHSLGEGLCQEGSCLFDTRRISHPLTSSVARSESSSGKTTKES